MSSSSPVYLPISNPQSSISGSGLGQQSQAPPSGLGQQQLIPNLFNSLRHGLSRHRPWFEFLNRSAFSMPDSISDATLRIRKNYSYFRVNYLSAIALIFVFCLVSNPWSLFLIAALVSSWMFMYLFRPSDQPLILFGRSFKDSEILIGLVVFSVCVVFLTSVGSVLISALAGGIALVCTHGALRSPDDLFLEEEEVHSNGFLAFFTGADSPAPAPAPATAPART